MNSLIRKLLFSINQSYSGCLIYLYYKVFDRAKDANMYEIKSRKLLSQKIFRVEEELDSIDADGTGNLNDLLRLVFIAEELRNLKVVVDGGELIRNINQKKKSDVLQACRCPP